MVLTTQRPQEKENDGEKAYSQGKTYGKEPRQSRMTTVSTPSWGNTATSRGARKKRHRHGGFNTVGKKHMGSTSR
ncbi:MAG: hypothetical protein ACUVTH_12635 [Thermogutta sp.]